MVLAVLLGFVALLGLPLLVLVLILDLFANQTNSRERMERLEGKLLALDEVQATWWQRLEALEDQIQQVDQRLAELILCLQGLDLDLPRLEPARFEPTTPDSAPFDPTKVDLVKEQDQPSRPLPQSSRLRGPEAEPDLPPQGTPETQVPPIPGPPWTPAPASEPVHPAASVPAGLATPPPQRAQARPPVSTRPSAPVAPSRPKPGVAASRAKRRSEPTPLQLFWRRLERLVVANWTGILGVVMVVAGVSFVTINMALTMGPLERFWLTVAAAAALVVPHLLWGQRDPWQNLTAWMRSGGAALFLFACSAAGGVPDLGLTWQRDPGGALALLVLGGLANLLVALVARSQTIAALHAVLTLVPLMIAAPSALTLGLGSLVAVVSLLLPWRRPWHGQRLVACLAYSCFQLTWVARSGDALELASPGGPSLRWLAAAAAIAVFGCGALLPHLGLGLAKIPTAVSAAGAPEGLAAAGDTPWAGRSAMPLQLLGLLSNWSGLGLALFLYPQTPGLRFGGLVLGWAAATVLARRTPRSSRPWLARCDTLVAQALAIAALFSLLGPIANGPLLVFALFVEAVLFVRLGLDRTDPWIGVVGWGLVNLGGFGLPLTVLDQVAVPGQGALAGGANPLAIAQQNRVLLLAASAMTIAVQAHLHRRPPDPRLPDEPAPALLATAPAAQALPIPPLLGWLAAALTFGAAWCCGPAGWQELVALASLGPLLLLGRRRPLPGLVSGSATAIVLSHGVSWVTLAAGHPWSAVTLWPHLLALLALGLVLAFGGSSKLVLVAIDLIGISTGLGAFLLLAPLSPLAPAVAWLGLSLLALGAAHRLGGEKATHALILGLVALLIAGIWGLAEGGPGSELVALGGLAIPARWMVDGSGLGLVLVWWRWQASPQLAENRLWKAVHPLLVEAFLLGTLLTVALEVPGPWWPAAWSLLALGLLSPGLGQLLAPRIKLYSVVLQWLAIASVVTSSLSPAPGSQNSLDQPIGLLAITIQVLYVVASHRWLVLAGPGAGGSSGAMARFAAALGRHRNRALYYPLFLGIALDLASRYNHSVLTLLWATQAFVLFGLSALLRDNQFRYLALVGLGGCLLRLVAVDMRQADLGLRGLVFIGVGLLMLAMNALYNRFRSRFEAGGP